MGCWNETCGITHLPIRSDDEIVFFLLEMQDTKYKDIYRFSHGLCYANDIWRPVFLPVYGKYNDYGNINEEESSWKTKFILDYFKASLDEKTTDSKYPHDLIAKRENINSIEYLGDLVHANKAMTGKRPIGLMFAHRWAYDMLTSSTYDMLISADAIPLAAQIDFGKQWYQTVCDIVTAEAKKNFKHDYQRLMFEEGWIDKFKFEAAANKNYNHNNLFQRAIQFNQNHYNFKKILMDGLVAKCRANVSVDDPELVEELTEMAKFLTFNYNFDLLRRTYAPQAGKGSQDMSSQLHRKLASAMVDFIDAEERKYNEDEGDAD